LIDPTWVSVLPPVVAIVLAVWTRHVYLSLGAGIWMGRTILSGWNPLAGLGGSVEAMVGVFADQGNTSVLLFTLAIGSLIATIGSSGGVRGFVDFVETRGWVDSPRKAQGLAWIIGLVIFIESNVTVLIAGAVSRPLFDRYRVSREKLAYLIDSTILVPLNAWGAYNLGLRGNLGVQDPLAV
jgi:Na+/H+ antiporter NhaC